MRGFRFIPPAATPVSRLMGLALALALAGGHARAAEKPPEAASLTAEQISSAVSTDAMTVPTPGELFAALSKQCKPNWPVEFREPIASAFSDRAQIALNLGGLIADGYIAIEAMDARQVKNLGKDILKLSAALGVSKEILDRASSITQFADENDWNALKEELEATQNEVKQAMEAKHDDDLIALVSLGGWIRGTQAVTDVVAKNFSQPAASILRQPAVVKFLRAKLTKLPPKEQDKPLIKSLGGQLDAVEKLVSFPYGSTPTLADVKALNDRASAMVQEISTKQ